ncbi:hypothetical protein D6792_04045 [Candidatus Parcubacteria bacterium]|jgi:hypothetical protein|nr:MAG: hypothetical protein D6792_04045 [Candidatus Parcubacteria bacterium]GIW69116.1 MAG: hypothetical protein KatS3mg100_610 [Candidatus Parcubacteria bacterium]
MDIEKLTRSQIILLALLVSFVSSIASSIVTMTLLDQSPSEAVPQIVNRVVERTVERVVTPVPSGSAEKDAPQKERVVEKTVVVREEELVPSAVAEARRYMVAVFRVVDAAQSTSGHTGSASAPQQVVGAQQLAAVAGAQDAGVNPPEGGEPSPASETRFVSFGLVVGQGSVLVPDRVAIKDARYMLQWSPEGDTVPARVAKEGVGPFAILAIEGEATPPVASPPTLLDPASLKLGQAVVIVGGVARPTITSGIISALPDPLLEPTATTTALASLFPEVAIAASGNTSDAGAVAVSLFKEVVAMYDGKVYRVITPQGLTRLTKLSTEREGSTARSEAAE